jgi:hypothetical protein
MDLNATLDDIDVKIMGAFSAAAEEQRIFYGNNIFIIDTENPQVLSWLESNPFINETFVQSGSFALTFAFNEAIQAGNFVLTSNSASLNNALWSDFVSSDSLLILSGSFNDENEEMLYPNVVLQSVTDLAGNAMELYSTDLTVQIDTYAPQLTNCNTSALLLDESTAGSVLQVEAWWNESMNANSTPNLVWNANIDLQLSSSAWIDSVHYVWNFVVSDNNQNEPAVYFAVEDGLDEWWNVMDSSNCAQPIEWVMNPWVEVLGCVDMNACNYDSLANTENGSCYFTGDICDDGDSSTFNDVWTSNCECQGAVWVNELEGLSALLYPNPGNEEVQLFEGGEWMVYDTTGRLMGKWNLMGLVKLNTTSWSSGIYSFYHRGKNYRWVKV